MTPNGLWIFDARKAKDAAAKIVAHFSAQSLEEALREAFDASTITREPPRIFIPSRSKPDLLVKFLQEPEKYKTFIGESVEGRGVYGNWDTAVSNRTVQDNPHKQFFVYDHAHGILVDYINREGASILPAEICESYLKWMERGLARCIKPYHHFMQE